MRHRGDGGNESREEGGEDGRRGGGGGQQVDQKEQTQHSLAQVQEIQLASGKGVFAGSWCELEAGKLSHKRKRKRDA